MVTENQIDKSDTKAELQRRNEELDMMKFRNALTDRLNNLENEEALEPIKKSVNHSTQLTNALRGLQRA
jgi:hypothetical protein